MTATGLDWTANAKCGFTLKCVRNMTRIYSQMHRTNKYSQTAQSFGQFGQMVECSFTN